MLLLAGIASLLLLRPPGSTVEAEEPNVTPTSLESSANKPPLPTFDQAVKPLVGKYCAKCHGLDEKNAGIDFPKYTAETKVVDDRKTWTKVLDMLRSGEMPPEDEPQPSRQEREALVKWLDESLNRVDCELPQDPGRVTVRRLNRAEYDNTIRDLVGVDLRLAADFPSDDVGEGFDNIGDVLSISPLLFERYMDAAEKIAESAIVAFDPSKAQRQIKQKSDLRGIGAAKLGEYGVYNMFSAGGVVADFDFPRKGEYLLRAEAGADQAGPAIAKMQFSLDNKPVGEVQVKARPDDMEAYEIRLTLDKGKRSLAAAFTNDYYQPNAPNPKDRGDRNLYVRSLEVVGPLDVDANAVPASHQRIVIAKPGDDKNAKQAATEVLRKFMRRAFRRPVTDADVEPYAGLVEIATQQGDTYERGIQVAVSAVLVSPQFLFRIERDPDPKDPTESHALNDFELASRLSYFIWSSMPDDELLSLAEQGKLNDDKVLVAQAKRMLKDPKSCALVDNFAAQWLNLRNLDLMAPDPAQFAVFNDELRADMRRETEMFFEAVMRDDRSILDFISGDFTFVNERLASHYGMPNVKGEEFRRVALVNGRRAGILTHASILTLTSNPTRTSPVKRGKWIMENILGTPPPEPPADVPELEDVQKANPNATLREQLEIHRKDVRCSVCHVKMDPLGLAFENFDAIGRWREKDGKLDINASGKLPSGETFDGPMELVQILNRRDQEFSRALAEKMLTFALGRGLQYFDRCTVDDIIEALQQNEFRFSTLVTEIAQSEPFRNRRGEGGEK